MLCSAAEDFDGDDSPDGGNDPSTGSDDEEEDSSESEGAEGQGGLSDAEGSDGGGVASTSEIQSGRKAKRQRKGQGAFDTVLFLGPALLHIEMLLRLSTCRNSNQLTQHNIQTILSPLLAPDSFCPSSSIH